MRVGLIISLIFHVAVIALAMITFASRVPLTIEIPPNIPVEFLEISDETNVSAAVESEPEIVEEEVVEEVEPPTQDVAAAEPQPAPIIEEAEPEFNPFEEAEAEPEPEPVAEEPEPELTPPAPTVRPSRRPDPPAPRREEDFFGNMGALLDRTPRDQQDTVVDPNAAIADETRTASAEQSRSAAGLGTGLTVSEIDALKAQIEDCWNIPAGAQDAENLIIELRVFLAPDGTVQRTEILNRGRYNTDSFYRAATDSAVRAVERCENGTNFDGTLRRGYSLPRERYEDWRSVRLTFDPSQLL